MVVSALRILQLLALLTVLLVSTSWSCFGPKLFIGAEADLEGEMRYYLVSIYLHEKTGIDSIKVDLKKGQTAIDAIVGEEIDLGFAKESTTDTSIVLRLKNGLNLYAGDRPLNDIQFSTVGRVFLKMQKRIDQGNLEPIRQKVAQGTLPAAAVRDFMMENGWI